MKIQTTKQNNRKEASVNQFLLTYPYYQQLVM